MPLLHLADLLPETELSPPVAAVSAAGLTADSREVRPGYLFAALPGTRVDGRQFAARAVEQGAIAILTGAEGLNVSLSVPVITSPDPRRALALAAARLHGPQPETVVAVTGTNGKTSVANFTRQIWAAAGWPAAAVGTLGIVTDEGTAPLAQTTPDPVQLHGVLAGLARRGIDHVVIEASSHGLHQRRVDGVRLAAGAFTNLTRDHLDYHPDFEAYLAAKRRLFDTVLPEGATAVVNMAGQGGAAMAQTARQRGRPLLTIGGQGADIALLERELGSTGQQLKLTVGGYAFQVALPLVGDFQASNALVALGLALATGVSADVAVDALSRLQGVPGRLELVGFHVSGAPVFVDFAHTPDALAQVLAALRPHTEGHLVVVFGCGGERDPGKRSQMGRIAATEADHVIVTDDNPRSEDPALIRAAILKAVPKAVEIGDRAAAIAAAISDIRAGDMVVIAGKGHEQGQIVKGEVRPFDDRAMARSALAILNGGGRS